MVLFDILDKLPLRIGITDRTGGVSKGVYGQMNTSFYKTSQFETACTDIKIALDALGITAKTIIATRQTHSNHILRIDENFDFDNLLTFDVSDTALADYRLYVSSDTDGLMTKRRDIVLMTFYADCVPLMIYDPINQAVAALHSGWRGTSNRFAEAAVKLMIESYNSQPETLLAGIGQSAGGCCYEVDEPVFERFEKNYSKASLDQIFKDKPNGKYFIDLKMANQILFKSCGISEDHIEIKPYCTICHSDRFHSHRKAAGGERGSMSMFVQLGADFSDLK